MNRSFWKDKRVFITGHSGFKGGWLSLWLYNMGANVYGFSLRPSKKNNFFDITNLNNLLFKSTFEDIRDIKKLKEEIRYLTKCLFEDPSLSHVELIDVPFLDIQNDILLNYVSSNPEMYDYSSEEDLCILSCIIFTEKNISPYFWKSVKQTEDLKQSRDNDLNLLIDYCVQHTLL